MNDHKKFKRLIEPALYGELMDADREFFQTHMHSCTECAAEYSALAETLGAVRERQRTEPDQQFMDSFWMTLEPKLQPEQRPLSSRLNKILASFAVQPSWSYRIAGAAAILIVGIVIGHYFEKETVVTSQKIIAAQHDSLADQQATIQALQYIERSKLLLMGLTNYTGGEDDIETLNLPYQKKISKELIVQAAELKQILRGSSNQEIRKLVSDIELVLMQVANLDSKVGLSGVEVIKDGVKAKGIILKIYIQEMNNHDKNAAPVNDNTKNEKTKI